MRTVAVLVALLAVTAAGFAQPLMGPMGYGRPPGHGPQLDRDVITQLQALQTFLTSDLGLTLGNPPTVRAGVVVRRFWGAFELDGFYRNKFKSWKNKLFTTPGAMALGIDVTGIDYLFTNVALDYNSGTQLGDYHGFRLESTARAKLAADAKKLHGMAAGYIRKLEERLAFEARLGGMASTPGSPPRESARSAELSTGGVGTGTSRYKTFMPETPTTILNVVEGGEETVRRMLDKRRAEREGR